MFYLHAVEAVPDVLRKLRVLAGDNSVSWYSAQGAGFVAVNGCSGVILAKQLVFGLLRI